MSVITAPNSSGRLIFVATFVCSALTTVVAVTFFVIGVGDGSVSSFNLALWLGLLSAMGLSLWGGHALRARGRSSLAIAALAVTAVPGVFAALFILLVLITQPHWN